MRGPTIKTYHKEKSETELHRWMEENSISNWTLAKQLQCTHLAVFYWRWNMTIPSLFAAQKIERVTRGAIPMTYWCTTPLGKKHFGPTADWNRIRETSTAKKRRYRERQELKARQNEMPKEPFAP